VTFHSLHSNVQPNGCVSTSSFYNLLSSTVVHFVVWKDVNGARVLCRSSVARRLKCFFELGLTFVICCPTPHPTPTGSNVPALCATSVSATWLYSWYSSLRSSCCCPVAYLKAVCRSQDSKHWCAFLIDTVFREQGWNVREWLTYYLRCCLVSLCVVAEIKMSWGHVAQIGDTVNTCRVLCDAYWKVAIERLGMGLGITLRWMLWKSVEGGRWMEVAED
jgi:hypothetical protein